MWFILPWSRSRGPVLTVLVLVLSAGCGEGGQESGNRHPAALPPGLEPPKTTNANATPPAVPYDSATPRTLARTVASWPHDSTAYTQGLAWAGGRLLESTGLEGHSGVRELDLASGRVTRSRDLGQSTFGEGIALLSGRIYQLTWQQQRGYVYNGATFAVIDSFSYSGEGWGLATDGHVLYMSDGTSRIRVVAPDGFVTVRTFQVNESGRPVWMLNELEWVHGELWANIYTTTLIARIDPVSGNVRGWIDVEALLSPAERQSVKRRGGTANGIAFDSIRGRVLLTGKLWPRIFAVDLRSPPLQKSMTGN